MEDYTVILISLILGYFMGIVSMIIGACLMSRASRVNGLLPEMLEPKGDVFTIDTPDDIPPFPDNLQNEAEEHILKKTNKFLESFGLDRNAEDK